MMSLRTIRRITKATWATVLILAASLTLAVAATPSSAVVAIVGTSGVTMIQVGVEWVFGGLFAFGAFLFTLVGVVLKVFNDRMGALEVGASEHGERLAAGGEQLKKLKDIERKVDHIIEFGCARSGTCDANAKKEPAY